MRKPSYEYGRVFERDGAAYVEFNGGAILLSHARERLGEDPLPYAPTSTHMLHGFYVLSHALQYVAQTRNEPWETNEYVLAANVLQPIMREIAKPFREAGIFKAEVRS